MSEGKKDYCCEVKNEDVEKIGLTEAAKEILDTIIWDELEKARQRITRKYTRKCTNYIYAQTIGCPGKEFRTRVYNTTIKKIVYNKLIGKKYFNVKRLARQAIYEELLLEFGK